MNIEFPPSVPVGRDGNLKCSAIWGIVRLLKYQTIPMTDQDKANIFDVVIKPFLCSDANNDAPGSGNLFAEAIRTLINTALLAQRDASSMSVLLLEMDSVMASNLAPSEHRPERLLSMCLRCVIPKRRFSRLSRVLSRVRELTEPSILPLRKCTSKASLRAKSLR